MRSSLGVLRRGGYSPFPISTVWAENFFFSLPQTSLWTFEKKFHASNLSCFLPQACRGEDKGGRFSIEGGGVEVWTKRRGNTQGLIKEEVQSDKRTDCLHSEEEYPCAREAAIRTEEDYGMFVKMLINKPPAEFDPETSKKALTYLEEHPNSVRNRKKLCVLRKIRRGLMMRGGSYAMEDMPGILRGLRKMHFIQADLLLAITTSLAQTVHTHDEGAEGQVPMIAFLKEILLGMQEVKMYAPPVMVDLLIRLRKEMSVIMADGMASNSSHIVTCIDCPTNGISDMSNTQQVEKNHISKYRISDLSDCVRAAWAVVGCRKGRSFVVEGNDNSARKKFEEYILRKGLVHGERSKIETDSRKGNLDILCAQLLRKVSKQFVVCVSLDLKNASKGDLVDIVKTLAIMTPEKIEDLGGDEEFLIKTIYQGFQLIQEHTHNLNAKQIGQLAATYYTLKDYLHLFEKKQHRNGTQHSQPWNSTSTQGTRGLDFESGNIEKHIPHNFNHINQVHLSLANFKQTLTQRATQLIPQFDPQTYSVVFAVLKNEPIFCARAACHFPRICEQLTPPNILLLLRTLSTTLPKLSPLELYPPDISPKLSPPDLSPKLSPSPSSPPPQFIPPTHGPAICGPNMWERKLGEVVLTNLRFFGKSVLPEVIFLLQKVSPSFQNSPLAYILTAGNKKVKRKVKRQTKKSK